MGSSGTACLPFEPFLVERRTRRGGGFARNLTASFLDFHAIPKRKACAFGIGRRHHCRRAEGRQGGGDDHRGGELAHSSLLGRKRSFSMTPLPSNPSHHSHDSCEAWRGGKRRRPPL